MKRYLLLALLAFTTCITFGNTTFTNAPIAAWDKPLAKHIVFNPLVKSFTDPYVTNYGSYDIQPNTYYHRVMVTVNFNQSVGVPYYAVIRVYGNFSNGDWYRDYTLLLSSSQWTKSQEFSVAPLDEIYTEITELVDYGPQ